MSGERLKNYINGAWSEATGTGSLDIENPSTGEILGSVPLSSEIDVKAAVAAAEQAFPGWSSTPVSRRVKPLYKLVELLKQNEDAISRVLVEEMGKSIPDAAAEVKRALENTEVACGMPTLQQGDKVVGCADGIDGETLRLPVGVFAIISPFNFPAMVPFWFLPYALATGNTVVLKVSEQDPRTFNVIADLIDRIGLPPGVFNMVHGDKQVAETLLDHPVVKGVSFVGSSRVAGLVMEKCAVARKRCQSMGGAKNHLVAMPDAKVEEVVRNMITSCYGCAGQRCMAASAIVGVGDAMYETICEEFIAASKKVIISDPLDPAVANEPMVLGPVISATSKAFIHDMIETGVSEGATLVLDGRDVSVPGCEKGHFIGPTVFTDVKPGMEIHKTEIFGPVVVILKAADLDEAIKIINDHQYGNGASIYTQNGHYARRFKLETQCGMIGVNVGIPAPVAYLPFGGMKDSLYSDIKAQGKSVINFFTEEKIVTERYWEEEG